jgi:hypothetical protein
MCNLLRGEPDADPARIACTLSLKGPEKPELEKKQIPSISTFWSFK